MSDRYSRLVAALSLSLSLSQLVAGIPRWLIGQEGIPSWWQVYQVYTQVVACIPSLFLPYSFFVSITEQSSLPIVIIVIFFGLFVSLNSKYTLNSCSHLTWLANKYCILAEVQLCEKRSLRVQDINLKRLHSWHTHAGYFAFSELFLSKLLNFLIVKLLKTFLFAQAFL